MLLSESGKNGDGAESVRCSVKTMACTFVSAVLFLLGLPLYALFTQALFITVRAHLFLTDKYTAGKRWTTEIDALKH